MRSSNSSYWTPDALHVWRAPAWDKWYGICFQDVKAEIWDVGWYYQNHHCEFVAEADDKCLYIKVVKADPDTDFTRTIGVKISWENGKIRFPIPSINFEDNNDDNHRIIMQKIDEYLEEDACDFMKEDGTYDIEALVDKIWSYYKIKESYNYWGGRNWECREPDYRKNIEEMWTKLPELLYNYVKEKVYNDRG